ncbi:hypothetical protein CHUAL_008815 [Chamberlinius hualienensis]
MSSEDVLIFPPPPVEFNGPKENDESQPDINVDEVQLRHPPPTLDIKTVNNCPSTSSLSPETSVAIRRANSFSDFELGTVEKSGEFKFPGASADSGCVLATGDSSYQLMPVNSMANDADCRRHSWSPRNALECCHQHHCNSSSLLSPSENRYYRSPSPMILSVDGFSNRSSCNSPLGSPTSFKSISPGANDILQIPTESGPMVLQLVLPKNSENNQGSLVPVSQNKETAVATTTTAENLSATTANQSSTNTCTTVSTISNGTPNRPEHPLSIINIETKHIILPTPEHEKKEIFRKNLTTLLSCIYAIFIVMFGGVIYVADILQPKMAYGEIFTIYLTLVGLAWLGFLHFDIRVYLNSLINWIKQERANHAKENAAFDKSVENLNNQSSSEEPKSMTSRESVRSEGLMMPQSYTFKTGPHSSSFYLKIGAAVFCFGHLIHEGLLLSRQIAYFTSENRFLSECADAVSLILQIIHPLFSFYQLFMVFKYSNIVIHRYKETARFAIMHIIAANLCLWVNTIIRETEEALAHKKSKEHYDDDDKHHDGHYDVSSNHSSGPSFLQTSMAGHSNNDLCVSKTILSSFTMQAAPYLYPFTIEYSLLLVGVWFIVWYNIGSEEEMESDGQPSGLHLMPRDQTEEGDGTPAEFFSSNLVIHVDCHSANRGLFAGLFILLATVVSVIIFFVAMTNDDYIKTGIIINNVSDTVLMLLMIFSAAFAYRQTALLDINEHAVTFLDNFLLFIALPCFFLYAIFNVVASIAVNNPFNVVISILCVIQVVIQTPFIVDGLRRCSNSYILRFKKPGREIITFLVVCNVAAWILETFEIKSYDAQSDRIEFYGSFVWTLLSHVTLPLTLFYRFHSSVCLVDMWKVAYEQGD